MNTIITRSYGPLTILMTPITRGSIVFVRSYSSENLPRMTVYEIMKP